MMSLVGQVLTSANHGTHTNYKQEASPASKPADGASALNYARGVRVKSCKCTVVARYDALTSLVPITSGYLHLWHLSPLLLY